MEDFFLALIYSHFAPSLRKKVIKCSQIHGCCVFCVCRVCIKLGREQHLFTLQTPFFTFMCWTKNLCPPHHWPGHSILLLFMKLEIKKRRMPSPYVIYDYYQFITKWMSIRNLWKDLIIFNLIRTPSKTGMVHQNTYNVGRQRAGEMYMYISFTLKMVAKCLIIHKYRLDSLYTRTHRKCTTSIRKV